MYNRYQVLADDREEFEPVDRSEEDENTGREGHESDAYTSPGDQLRLRSIPDNSKGGSSSLIDTAVITVEIQH